MKHKLYFLLLLTMPTIIHAQDWEELQGVYPNESYSYDWFAENVAIHSNLAVISARFHDYDENGANYLLNAGAAYVFEKNLDGSWQQLQKLVPDIRFNGDQVGADVLVDGSQVFVSSFIYRYDQNGENSMYRAGAVFVFEQNDNGIFEQVQTLVASDRQQNSDFGSSMEIINNTLIVGAPGESIGTGGDNYSQGAGAAYVFERNELTGIWTEAQKLSASDRDELDRFGQEVDVTEDFLIISANRDEHDAQGNNPLDDAGSVYVFQKQEDGSWSEHQKLSASDRAEEDSFGYAIDILEGQIAVAAYSQDQNIDGTDWMPNAGAVYIFSLNENSWTQTQKLVASDRETNDRFGSSLSLSSDQLLVGAELYNLGHGGVYVFEQTDNGWDEDQILAPSDTDTVEYYYFGCDMYRFQNQLLVGAMFDTVNGSLSAAGKAYFFELNGGLSTNDIINAQDDVFMYPNPTTKYLNILSPHSSQNQTLTITNALGQRVLEKIWQNQTQQTIELPDAPGIYTVTIDDHQQHITTKKIIKL